MIAFLLASAVPVAAVIWILLKPEPERRALLDRVPEGWGGKALAAGAAFAAMSLLAWVALPAFHRASAGLTRVLQRMRERGPVPRVLLFPLEFAVGLVWLLFQILFAVDAFLIVAAGLIGLLLAIRIIHPDFLPGILPSLAG